jgi:cytochrome c-type biogenesis protein
MQFSIINRTLHNGTSESHMQKAKKAIILGLFSIFIIAGFFSVDSSLADSSRSVDSALNFIIADKNGSSIALSEFKGSPVVIHITNIEIPICKECEKDLRSQLNELAKLKLEHPDTQIITINLRKNPYSGDGRSLAQKWWQVNISWPWMEDLEPYQIAGKFSDYWNVRGGFSNPTLLLTDKEGRVARIYHVYRVGEGEVDGVQSAELLYKKLEELRRSEWTGVEGEISKQNVSALGMFFLGIITSLAPCSIALMIAVFSYVLTLRRKDEYLRKSISASKEGFMIGVAFTIGMATVFFVLGLFISQVGLFVRDSKFFDLAAGGIMIILGISNIKPLEEMLEPVLSLIRKDPSGEAQKGESLIHKSIETSIGLFKYSAFIGAFTLGVFFALGWAPCALSMVFPVLIWLASQNVTPIAGGIMLFIFGLGHGVPIIPISTFSRAVGGRIGEKYVSVGKWTTKFFGMLVIAVGMVYAARYFGFLLW